MNTYPTRSRFGPQAVAALLLAVAALYAWPALAAAQNDSEGAATLRAVEAGQRSCNQLQAGDFEQIGEYVMGRMVGSQQAHESMNNLMRGTLGDAGEQQMHSALGQRFAGCGQGRFPAGVGGMMNGIGGMMGIVGMMGGGSGAGSGSGPSAGQGYGAGSMMNGFFGNNQANDDNDEHVGGWIVAVMIAMMALFLGAIFFMLRGVRGASGGGAPLQILERRYASGEIDQKEYERRRGLLGGGK